MKNKQILLLLIQLFLFPINSFTDQVQSSTPSQYQPAFKISIYKKDPKKAESQTFCDQLLINDMSKYIFITCHANNTIEYLLFSKYALEDDNSFKKLVQLTKESKKSNVTTFYFSKDPLGMALSQLKYQKTKNQLVKTPCNKRPIETEKTINNKLVFTKNNFLAVLEEM